MPPPSPRCSTSPRASRSSRTRANRRSTSTTRAQLLAARRLVGGVEQGARLGCAGAVAVGLAHRERARVIGARGVALAAKRGGAAEGEQVEDDLARRADF